MADEKEPKEPTEEIEGIKAAEDAESGGSAKKPFYKKVSFWVVLVVVLVILGNCSGGDEEESEEAADEGSASIEATVEEEDEEEEAEAEEEAVEEEEAEAEAEAEEEEAEPYTIDSSYFGSELTVEFVEVTDEGVVFSFTTDEDRANMAISLFSVDGKTYRISDVYDSATDSSDYEFGIFTWSESKEDWIDAIPSTFEAGETELYLFSYPANVEFDELVIYCDWSIYILNSSGAVTGGPYTYYSYTLTFTKN